MSALRRRCRAALVRLSPPPRLQRSRAARDRTRRPQRHAPRRSPAVHVAFALSSSARTQGGRSRQAMYSGVAPRLESCPPPPSPRAAAERTRDDPPGRRRTAAWPFSAWQVHRRLRLEQHPHRHLVALEARRQQRRPPVLVLVVDDDRPRPEQLLQLLEAVLLRRHQQLLADVRPHVLRRRRRLGRRRLLRLRRAARRGRGGAGASGSSSATHAASVAPRDSTHGTSPVARWWRAVAFEQRAVGSWPFSAALMSGVAPLLFRQVYRRLRLEQQPRAALRDVPFLAGGERRAPALVRLPTAASHAAAAARRTRWPLPAGDEQRCAPRRRLVYQIVRLEQQLCTLLVAAPEQAAFKNPSLAPGD